MRLTVEHVFEDNVVVGNGQDVTILVQVGDSFRHHHAAMCDAIDPDICVADHDGDTPLIFHAGFLRWAQEKGCPRPTFWDGQVSQIQLLALENIARLWAAELRGTPLDEHRFSKSHP